MPTQVFTHGQLYVALSRIPDPDNLFICALPQQQGSTRLRNIVYRGLFTTAANSNPSRDAANSSPAPPAISIAYPSTRSPSARAPESEPPLPSPTLALHPQIASDPASLSAVPTPPLMLANIDEFERGVARDVTMSRVYCPFLTDVLDRWPPQMRHNEHEIVLLRHWQFNLMSYAQVVASMRGLYRQLGTLDTVVANCGLPGHIEAAEQELLMGFPDVLLRYPAYVPTLWVRQVLAAYNAHPDLSQQLRALSGNIDTALNVLRATHGP